MSATRSSPMQSATELRRNQQPNCACGRETQAGYEFIQAGYAILQESNWELNSSSASIT